MKKYERELRIMKLRLLDNMIDRTYESRRRVNTHSRCFHSSFLVRKNNIISVGFNNARKSHPLAQHFGFVYLSTHAEFDAIRRCPYGTEYSKCTLVNIRVGQDGLLRYAKPCMICESMVRSFGIENVLYTIDGGEFWKL